MITPGIKFTPPLQITKERTAEEIAEELGIRFTPPLQITKERTAEEIAEELGIKFTPPLQIVHKYAEIVNGILEL